MSVYKTKTCKAKCYRCRQTLLGVGGIVVNDMYLHANCAIGYLDELKEAALDSIDALSKVVYFELEDGCTITLKGELTGTEREVQCHRVSETSAYFLVEDEYFQVHNKNDELRFKLTTTSDERVYHYGDDCLAESFYIHSVSYE